MKNTIDETTMNQLVSELATIFESGIANIPLPHFENKDGLFFHENQHSITVVKADNELKAPKFEESLLLGIYKIDKTNEEGKCYLFHDEIKSKSKLYSDFRSIHYINGERVDFRDTHDSWSGGANPNGLSENDAFSYIEMLCKIELAILNAIHCRFGVWKSAFYIDINIHYVDILVMQLTKDTIKEYYELVDCFEWLNINGVNKTEFQFDKPIPFIKNISGINEQEWSLINSLGIFINCFPVEDKIYTETWREFLDRKSKYIQESLIETAKENGSGWGVIKEFLTQENKDKNKGRISGEIYGL
jgi:hypothetical protein